MKQTITLILSLFFVRAFSQAPDWQWVKTVDGNGVEVFICDLAKDNNGNIYVAGSQKSGSCTFGISTVLDAGCFIAKIDPSGTWDWATKVGTNYGNRTISLTSAPNGDIYFTAFAALGSQFGTLTVQDTFTSSNNRLVVGKITSSGSFAWIKTAAIENNAGYSSISVDGNGFCYVTCRGSGQAQFDNISFNATQAAIAKLDNQGNWVWAKPYDGGYYDRIKVAPSGKIFVAGESYDLATYDTITFNGFGGDDVFVSRIDSNGNWLWVKSAGGSSTDRCFDISVNSSDEIFLTGYYRESATFGGSSFNSPGNRGLFVSKLNSSGVWQWTKSVNGTGNLTGNSIVTDANSNAYLTGYFELTESFGTTSLTSYGNSDVFISKIDNQGNFVWSGKAGSTGDDDGSNILLDNGILYVASTFAANATYGSVNVTFANTTGANVGKLNSTVGIGETPFDNASVQIYPNPISTVAIVSSLSDKVTNYQLFNSLGELVVENKVSSNLFKVDMSSLSSGLYFLKLRGSNLETVSKIVKD